MAVESAASNLGPVVALLGAGVLAVPLFKKLGLGSVLGYFTAGLIIGPFGLKVFTEPSAILHVAELGVVMFLFIIGLEMRPSRLWNLRREIFGLGVAQVVLCSALLTGAGLALGLPPAIAFVAGAGFVLSSTAVVMQILSERGETSTPAGQQAISILLLEDLAIVPLLALVAFIAPQDGTGSAAHWQEILIACGALAALLVTGRWLLNPMFAVLAAARAREVMTAAALLVVLGSALLMDLSGLSMAMGAFLAGVLLSESSFRHQLEADIEPFKGILLGLFFLAVGMSLDLAVVVQEWRFILLATGFFIAAKSVGIFAIARLFGASSGNALARVAFFAQGGEFAFVLYAAATAEGIFDTQTNAVFTATIILSMALTPFIIIAADKLLPKGPVQPLDVDEADGLSGNVLLIGFGRFGQIASQALLARGIEVSIIENDAARIKEAARFGFKVYFGDGTRLDVLHASGADKADAVLICIDKRADATHIASLIKAEFPLAKLLVRSYDRGHAIDLARLGVDYEIRETFESALAFSTAALKELGVAEDERSDLIAEIRRRDCERLDLQIAEGMYAGTDLMFGNAPVPEPLTEPRKKTGKMKTPLLG